MHSVTLPQHKSAQGFTSLFASTLAVGFCALTMSACQQVPPSSTSSQIAPLLTTDSVDFNSDDPAIWIDRANPANSLIIGTDKGRDGNGGALFVFGLDGKEHKTKTIRGLKRPNNVDIAYGLHLGDQRVDIAVCTERNANAIRVFSLPDMKPIDNGGITVFEGDSLNLPMGVALFKDSKGTITAIVSRKNGPLENYLWQYELTDNKNGVVEGRLVRKFGKFSGKKEIEAIAVDQELGYVYYSDEGVGVRKYYSHPDSTGKELAFFASKEFKGDIEGISIYTAEKGEGYILVSDQQANQFHIFSREGTGENPHAHRLLKTVRTQTLESDGSDVTSVALTNFPKGFFVAMSNPRVFQIYRWEDLAGEDLP